MAGIRHLIQCRLYCVAFISLSGLSVQFIPVIEQTHLQFVEGLEIMQQVAADDRPTFPSFVHSE